MRYVGHVRILYHIDFKEQDVKMMASCAQINREGAAGSLDVSHANVHGQSVCKSSSAACMLTLVMHLQGCVFLTYP